MTVRRYAARRVNPFRGVMRVLDLGEARALSVDAVNWELQVKVERPVGWGSLNLGRTETLYSRYGVWSAADGLASYPVHPTLDRQRVHRAAAQIVAVLAADVPVADGGGEFPFADVFECWLLDGATDRPLALLATATEAPQALRPLHWRAAPNDDAEFSESFGRTERDALEHAVSRRGNQQAWFERAADGSGTKLGAGDTPLAAADFPELLLADDWPAPEAELLARYVDWLAARLLMLPLAAATRARLERAAQARPDDVAHFFHLYPEVADPRLMNALRVQARLVQAG